MFGKRKLGWTAKGIVGMIFLPLGLLFLAAGYFLLHAGAVYSPGAALAFRIVFYGEGFAFAGIGAVLLLLDIHRRKCIQFALDRGNYVTATAAAVSRVTSVRVRHEHPWVLECHYTESATGKLHVYKSRYLYSDPSGLIGREVRVYVDDYYEKYYYVDVDGIQPKAAS